MEVTKNDLDVLKCFMIQKKTIPSFIKVSDIKHLARKYVSMITDKKIQIVSITQILIGKKQT